MPMAQRLTFLIAFGALGASLGIRTAQTQTPQGTETKLVDVKVANSTMWDPVWITKVAIGNQFLIAPYNPFVSTQPGQVVPGQNFSVGADWLRDMTIYVTNRTSKPIAWLTVSMRFPQTGNGRTEPVWVYRAQLGRMPDAAAIDRNGKPIPDKLKGAKPLALQPGEALAIPIADYVDKITEYLKAATPLSAISECYLSIDSSELDDGTRWAGGAYSLPDAQRPGQWLNQARGYFPGDPHQYLPNVVKRSGESPQP